MAKVTVLGPQETLELQKMIEEQEEIIAALHAAIAANKAELEKLKKENKARFGQEEPEVKKNECGNGEMGGNSRARSSTFPLFGKVNAKPTENKLIHISKKCGYQSE